MGADIHAYVERVENSYTESIAKVSLNKHSDIFGLLAGVRGFSEPVYEPRGVPDNLGYTAARDYFIPVITDEEYEKLTIDALLSGRYDSPYVLREKEAEMWMKHGSKLRVEPNGFSLKSKFVTAPEFHSGSFLTAREYDRVLAEYRREFHRDPPRDYVALGDYLYALHGSRVVFWFDS